MSNASDRLAPGAMARTCAWLLLAVVSGGAAFLPAAVLVLGAGPAMAQGVPPLDAGAVLRQQEPEDRRATTPARPPAVQLPARADRAGDNAIQLEVKAFVIEGLPKAFTVDEIQGWLKPYLRRRLSLNELQDAVSGVTARYRSAGYLVGGAILPRQDVTDGSVTVLIQEGLADPDEPVRLQGQGLRLRPARALQVLQAGVPGGQPLRTDSLDRALLLLNDLPGLSVGAGLEPGSRPGTTRVVVNAVEGPLYTAQASLDNQGSRYTGSVRVHAALQLNNPTGRGEQYVLSATSSTEGDFQFVRWSTTHPLGANGLRMGLALNALHYQVGEELASLGAKGRAGSASINLRYPVQRTRLASLYATAGWDHTQVVNSANGADTSRKALDSVNLGAIWSASDQLASTNSWQATGSLTLGRLDLSGLQANLAQDQAGPRTNGSFQKINLGLVRTQALAPRAWLSAQLHGQVASGNLDSGEKLQLGGASGVRAYPGGEGAGDQGVRATLEARYLALPAAAWGEAQLLAFYDWGQVQQYRAPAGLGLRTPNRLALAGYGVGLQLFKPGTGELRLQWARKAGSNPGASAQGLDSDGRASKSRVWISAQLGF